MSSNPNTDQFNWVQGFTVDYDLKTGMSKSGAVTSKRRVSNMRGIYADEAATGTLIRHELYFPR